MEQNRFQENWVPRVISLLQTYHRSLSPIQTRAWLHPVQFHQSQQWTDAKQRERFFGSSVACNWVKLSSLALALMREKLNRSWISLLEVSLLTYRYIYLFVFVYGICIGCDLDPQLCAQVPVQLTRRLFQWRREKMAPPASPSPSPVAMVWARQGRLQQRYDGCYRLVSGY